MSSTSTYRERNSTADRALTILQMFNDEKLAISAVEIADELGVARSTAYRYIETLVQSRFLDEEPGGRFRLGVRILELARIARRNYGLAETALPVLRILADRTHQTALLTKLIGSSIVCLEREEWPGRLVRLSYERGTQLPINAGASALVLLAWLPESRVRDLLDTAPLRKFTPNTMTESDDIVARLRQIRTQGYAITNGEVDDDAVGIAAPVIDDRGDVVAGISVVLMRSRSDDDHIPALTEAVIEAGRTLSERIAVVG